MKVLILLAVLAVAVAERQKCVFEDKVFTTERLGARSAAQDDAESEIDCARDETLTDCLCVPFPGRGDDCDGALFREKGDVFTCVAKNGADGKGVQAKAVCKKLFNECSTTYTNMPSLKCPDKYALIGCMMQSAYKFDYGTKKPMVKRSGGLCATERGCEDCRVQIRCLRNAEYDA